jgi:sterol desaturase/sphingolipid hydroxylase (fatty acid hydroxylase superfamily)
MINAEMIFLLIVFWSLTIATLLNKERRRKLFARTKSLWAIDLTGLTIHGTIVPLFQMIVIYGLMSWIAPQLQGQISLPAPIAFLLSFVVIDYAYYWNHRLLHTKRIWRFHAVHHSGPSFDVFTTSRNSAITTFLILYVWANGVLLFLLQDKAAFVWGVALSNGLDILRHSGISSWPKFAPFTWIISPKEHAWHHSDEISGVNFGANFNLWDKLHGTYYSHQEMPKKLGSKLDVNLWTAFWKGAP